MAKVTGPAHSVRASGTLGGLITFDKRNIAHKPNAPGNQFTGERGNARQIFLSMSKALQLCQSSVKTDIKAAADPNRDWRAWMIRHVIDKKRDAWDTAGLIWAAFTQGQRDAWDAAADDAGFFTTIIIYASDDPISAGLAMFELGSALYNAFIITDPGEPAADNAGEWATAITGFEPPEPIGSREFNGTTDRIDWASVANLTGSPLTLSLWIYLDAIAHNTYMFTINYSGATYGIVLWVSTAGAVQFYRKATTTCWRTSATPALATGAWTHLLATHDGVITTSATIHLYQNGAEMTNYSGQNGATEAAMSGVWSIGGRKEDDARNVDGRIAQVATWDRVLDAAEIAQLASGKSPLFIETDLLFYFKGNTESLLNEVTAAEGTADGTTQVQGPGTGPTITYP